MSEHKPLTEPDGDPFWTVLCPACDHDIDWHASRLLDVLIGCNEKWCECWWTPGHIASHAVDGMC